MFSRVHEFTTGVYAVKHDLYLTNSYIVTVPGAVYLIDSGVYASGSDMLKALESIGRSAAEVKGILLTHWHNDHTGGASVIRTLSGAPVYYSAAAHDHFSGKIAVGWGRRLFDWMPDFGPFSLVKGIVGQCPPRPVTADRFVAEGDVIDGLFSVWDTPGHEDGHLSYWFPGLKILFTGDAIAVCDGHAWYMSSVLTKDQSLARESMVRCLKSGAEFICPGHRHPLRTTEDNLRQLNAHVANGRTWPLF